MRGYDTIGDQEEDARNQWTERIIQKRVKRNKSSAMGMNKRQKTDPKQSKGKGITSPARIYSRGIFYSVKISNSWKPAGYESVVTRPYRWESQQKGGIIYPQHIISVPLEVKNKGEGSK